MKIKYKYLLAIFAFFAFSVQAEQINGINVTGLIYPLKEAVRNFPVTLYTSRDCGPCDEARTMLMDRGIPFAERTVDRDEDLDHMKLIGGDGTLPYLRIGRTNKKGFHEDEWNSALSGVGYPKEKQLPSGYVYTSRRPAAPDIPKEDEVEAPEPISDKAETPVDTDGKPLPNFRF